MSRLKATLITPLSGPLALFGEASATGLILWARSATNLPAPWTDVELTVRDSGNDPDAAIRSTWEDRPDVLFGPYGSYPMLRAARASEQVIWNHGGATSRLTRSAFPLVINVLAPASTYFKGVLQVIHTSGTDIHKIILFHSSSRFGQDVARGACMTAIGLAMEVLAIPFEPSHAVAATPTVPDGDVLLVVGNFADELAVAPLLLTRHWRFAAFVGAGVEEVLAPLARWREGLLGPAQWIASAAPEPEEGPDARWFCTKYRAITQTDPPYPATQAFAAGLVCTRCLRDGGSCEDNILLAAAQNLICTTLYGKFQLDPLSGLQTGHRVLTVQWQHGQRRVVWPPEQAEAPLLPLHSDY